VESQDLTTEAGQRTYAALIGVSGAFAELTPVLDGAAASATNTSKALNDAIASLRKDGESLAVELLRAQGDNRGADFLAMGVNPNDPAASAVVAQYDANQATRALISSLNDLSEAAITAADASKTITDSLTSTGISLRDEYDVLTGVTTARNVAIRGYTEEQIALYDANAALQASIDLRKEEKTAIETSAASLQSLITKYTAPLTISGAQSQVAAAFNPSVVDTLMGQSSTGFSDLVLEYAQSLDPLTEAGRAAIAQLQGLVPALDVMAGSIQTAEATARDLANTNQGWQDQLDILNGAETDRSILLRDAGDDSTRALMQLVWAAQDFKTASDAAAQVAAQAAEESMRIKTQAAEEAARVAKQLAETNKGWQDQLDILTGKETERSIALRDAGAASTRALMRQVYAAQDLKTATEELANAWKGVSDSIAEEIKRIRGLVDAPQTYAQAQAAFAIATAQARAGDLDVAKTLPGLSQALLELVGDNSASAFDVRVAQAKTANSLELTNGYIANNFNPPSQQADSQSAAEIRILREDNRAQAKAINDLTLRMARVLERWEGGGMPATRVEA
jgi:FtsZ-binding cell division protein ZapB